MIACDHPLLAGLLQGSPPGESPLRHVETLPGREPLDADWPGWVSAELRSALAGVGTSAPWPHQTRAAEAAWGGQSVMIATGTASGKSLAYQLPVLSAVMADPHARTVYLSPTKALAADQLRGIARLELAGVRAATLDGDTPAGERDWIRQHANVVLTNPDMLHHSLLPRHGQWASFWRRLRYVVVDECHQYRGIFGSHVALILRRLRRVCASYGSSPVFILASATAANPGPAGERLVGVPLQTVDRDSSPRGPRTFALWEPPLTSALGERSAPVRRSAAAEAARLLADLVVEGARTLVFVRSRRGAELTALAAKRHLAEAGAGELADRIAAYRGGYLAEERRSLEARLVSGELLAVATTNALELGIDIAGLDAVILAGYPGTLASLWQQAGRAGRRGQPSLVVFVASADPLDTYLVHHPAAIFDRPVEATVTDPTNPYVLTPQLSYAAYEAPITAADIELFGGGQVEPALDRLVAQGVLRRRATGWFWVDRNRPRADIRSGAQPVALVESASGALLGTLDSATAPAVVHPGAVYLHQGQTFEVEQLELVAGTGGSALLHRADPDWITQARDVTDITVCGIERAKSYAGVGVYLGTVQVSNQVIGYQRRRLSGEVIDETPLDMPVNRLRTTAVWYTLDDQLCTEAGLDPAALPGALHAAEHAAIGLLPLFATCDRWDIGGVSTGCHADTLRPTVFVYDGHPGGAGFAARGHAVLTEWLSATLGAVTSCECLEGCPSCVQSPKCGNGNDPLDKAGAELVLRTVLGALAGSPR